MTADSMPPPLLEVDWVAEHRLDDDICLLHILPRPIFERRHIETGVHSDYDDWRVTNAAGVDLVLPSVATLNVLIGALGIDYDQHIVIVGLGESASDVSAAARVYWTLKSAGLDRLSLLNGGLLAYTHAGLPGVVSGPSAATAKPFSARLRTDWLADAAAVQQALESGDLLIDHRSAEEYLGLEIKGPGERPGTLPGAIHLEYEWLTHMDSGRLRDVATLKALYRARGIPLDRPHIGFCYTAHRSSISWFVVNELFGLRDIRMYDASMIEWSRHPDWPLVRLVQT